MRRQGIRLPINHSHLHKWSVRKGHLPDVRGARCSTSEGNCKKIAQWDIELGLYSCPCASWVLINGVDLNDQSCYILCQMSNLFSTQLVSTAYKYNRLLNNINIKSRVIVCDKYFKARIILKYISYVIVFIFNRKYKSSRYVHRQKCVVSIDYTPVLSFSAQLLPFKAFIAEVVKLYILKLTYRIVSFNIINI